MFALPVIDQTDDTFMYSSSTLITCDQAYYSFFLV